MDMKYKALHILGPQNVRIVEVPVTELKENEVLIKMIASSICNQHELKIWIGKGYSWLRYPLQPGEPGHEGVGVVVEIGEKVSKVNKGDIVVLTGIGGPGLHAEYTVRTEDSVVKFKRHDLSHEDAAPLELFACVMSAIWKSGGPLGRRVVVLGLGPAGLTAVQLLRVYGAVCIIGVDPVSERRERALECGADDVTAPDTPEYKRLLEEGVEYVFETSGNPNAIIDSFRISREKVVIFGYYEGEVPVNPAVWFHHNLTIYSNKALDWGGMRNVEVVIRLFERKLIDPGKLITHRIRLEEYPHAMKLIAEKKAIKVIIRY